MGAPEQSERRGQSARRGRHGRQEGQGERNFSPVPACSGGGTRTRTLLPAVDFESTASTNSATPPKPLS